MDEAHRLVTTSGGQVEIVARGGHGGTVLYFHGGHESAMTAAAAELYGELGYSVVALSRPGYGLTEVGAVSPADFSPLVDEVRDGLGQEKFLAVVGTSFGGPQAVAFASQFPQRVGSLVLHSAAPSSRPYPDSSMERLLGPVVFGPGVERLTWRVISGVMRKSPELGLRAMMASLSTRPVASWLPTLSAGERQEMRDFICALRSGAGFVIDVAHAGPDGRNARRRAQQQVTCPTLVTASHWDGDVAWEHAEDFRATIPNAQLVEIPAASHLFWIGPTRALMLSVIKDFRETLR
jgi:pimeloyl-ACP methyl ester carboxylesterase